jgi:hypothetical protein
MILKNGQKFCSWFLVDYFSKTISAHTVHGRKKYLFPELYILPSYIEENPLKTIGISKNVLFDFEKHAFHSKNIKRFYDWENQFINQAWVSSNWNLSNLWKTLTLAIISL